MKNCKANAASALQPSPTSKPNAETVWKQLEDVVVPRLRLSVIDRAVYYHLLRHSHLEGKGRCRFSMASLGRGTRLTREPVRRAIRRLIDHGVLRLVQRNRRGHVLEVRLPEEIRAAKLHVPHDSEPPDPPSLEEIDFMQTKALREAIHAREAERCFYCLRRLPSTIKCLDHVVPRARSGRNSYRNLVSACVECNVQKGVTPADDFLRALYRDRRLTGEELAGRIRALDALAAGDLRPALQGQVPGQLQRTAENSSEEL
jgi:5-methylcytosine-specific restriction endonuclease McrA